MNVLVIDNYDSFTHNLAHSIADHGATVSVHRNDAIDHDRIQDLAPDAIVISPGPGHPGNPRDFGVCTDVVTRMVDTPVLGICLGMQGMAHHTGGAVRPAPDIVHGETSTFRRHDHPVFAGLPDELTVGRYHSLAVDPDRLPDDWQPLGHTDDGTLMAMAHRDRPHIGLQFHPESILTPDGDRITANFLDIAKEAA